MRIAVAEQSGQGLDRIQLAYAPLPEPTHDDA